MDYTIKIGGAAGQGIQTIGNSLDRVFARAGFRVFSYQDYESRVRGGHNFYQIRFADRKVLAPRAPIDMLIALDDVSIPLHSPELVAEGSAVYDSSEIKHKYDDERFVDVPFRQIAVDVGGDAVMSNTVASAAALGMLGMDVDLLAEVLKVLLKKRPEAIEGNVKAARAGHEFAVKNCPRCAFQVPPRGDRRMVIGGNEAIGFAAIASGCKFYSAYPMTPSTGILNYMSGQMERMGLVVEQAEDEIAAINMIQGASFAGVRAMTGSSGGGFALMVEGLSLAGMTETPVVIVLAQRPAPATGFPTRTEQADLLFPLFAGHGEFPRVAFTPGTPEQAFRVVNKAFDLAEKYQVPAFIITDQLYADATWSLPGVDLSAFEYHDYRVRGEAFKAMKEYKRHAFTETGVSPLAVPGDAPHVVVTDSDEHSEEGHIVEDAPTRVKMVQKRWVRKIPLIRDEMLPPVLYGDPDPEITLVCWGSNYGVVREAVDSLTGKRVAMLHFDEVFPFPKTDGSAAAPKGNGEERRRPDFMDIIRGSRLAIDIENNVSGRFAWLVRAETGYEFSERISKFDGRPFTLEGLLEEIDVFL